MTKTAFYTMNIIRYSINKVLSPNFLHKKIFIIMNINIFLHEKKYFLSRK